MDRITARKLEKLPHKYQVMFAVFCAEQVIGLVREQDRDACQKAIDTAKRWLRGEVSKEECSIAANAAYAAAYTAASAAAYAAYAVNAASYTAVNAANVASAAAYASYAANAYAAYAANACKDRDKLVKEQWDYYSELLNLDSNLEKILVG